MFCDRARLFGFKDRRYRYLVKFAALLVLLVAEFAWAFDFPALSGRVVDQANVIPATQREALESKLKDLEDKSRVSSSSWQP